MPQSKPKHSQYHHFVPRFILRNFSHPKQESHEKGKVGKDKGGVGKKKAKRQKPEKGSYPGDPMLHIMDLRGDGEILEVPVATSYGMIDMYRDFREVGNQHRLEEELSKLESRAAQILHKVRKDYEAGQTESWMIRRDKDILRKFLFVMKYRSSGFHKRFYHDDSNNYIEDDRRGMLEYMKTKGYKRPIDVWYDNIRALVQVEIDADDKWIRWLMENMYPDDASWAIAHIKIMFLAFCTPSRTENEFMLSENVYSLFEGPVSPRVDLDTNKMSDGAYTEWHAFAPLSPRLMMVLRSNILPEQGDSEAQKKEKQKLFSDQVNQHLDPNRAGSILLDLPIRKAQTSYATTVGGRRELIPGEDGKPRKDHRFGFRFHAIETKHVNLINSIMFENTFRVNLVAFRSKNALRITLEWYLADPSLGLDGYPMKIVDGEDERLKCLKKLERIAQQMGSNVKMKYYQARSVSSPQKMMFHSLGMKLRQMVDPESLPKMETYRLLGGVDTTFFHDMDQASKMWNMRTKIDVWSQGMDEHIRQEIRRNLQDMFCQLPPSRLFLFLKFQRFQVTNPQNVRQTKNQQHFEKFMDEGSENIIAKYCDLFQNDRLCAIIYIASLQDINFAKRPEFNINADITLDENGIRCLHDQERIGFLVPASATAVSTSSRTSLNLTGVGIKVVEDLAREVRKSAPKHYPPDLLNPFWSDEMCYEMITRVIVKDSFTELMKNESGLEDLQKTMFNVIYPTLHDSKCVLSSNTFVQNSRSS